jgi:hypothetical protein
MNRILTGGCQCGAARYEIEGVPIRVYACHCTICQRQSGSAFAMAAIFPREGFRLAGVAPAHFVRAGHGRRFRCHFCPRCGTRLWHQWFTEAGDMPFLSLKPGTLDDTSWLRPGCHVWTQHAQPWVRFAPQDLVFAGQPSLEEMPLYAAP